MPRFQQEPSFRRASSFLPVHSAESSATSSDTEPESSSETAIIAPHLRLPASKDYFRPLVNLPSCGISTQAHQRLTKEVQSVCSNPPPGCTAGPKGDSLYEWAATITGPEESVYEGGIFFLELNLTKDYPFKPPKVTFQTRIYHCNIDSHGTVCLDILRDYWSPAMSIYTLLISIRSLLSQCDPQDALIHAIGQTYLHNRVEHDKTARLWTERYAC